MIPSMPRDDLLELFDAICDGAADEAQAASLEEVLARDPAARQLYVTYMHLRVSARYLADIHCTTPEAADFTEAFVDLAPSPTSAFVLLDGPLQGSAGHFLSGWPVAYLIATVIFGIGLLIGSLTPVSSLVQIVKESAPSTPSVVEAKTECVGRITGMVDCKWEGKKGDSPPLCEAPEGPFRQRGTVPLFPLVALGDRFALASGLMEITYDKGAKVILQGPVTYEVESAAGGFLSVGKLTARVERTKSEDPRPKTQDLNPKSEISKSEISKSPNLQISKLFVVRTPTATVTDLGTEFGVEVDDRGTRSRVFRGQVEVVCRAGSGAKRLPILLKENQSLEIDLAGGVATWHAAENRPFVRSLPRTIVHRSVSLADLVGGGDGFGSRVNWGISPSDAVPVPGLPEGQIVSNGKYQKYNVMPQIDGVFIPNGRNGPEQLDSAGHSFQFPPTSGTTCIAVCSKSMEPCRLPPDMSKRHPRLVVTHPAILVHANSGITFDLASIRASVHGLNLSRFQSVVIDMQTTPFNPPRLCDVWVFVDGQLRLSRTRFCVQQGPVEVDIPLKASDQFLTLVTTDGGDDIHSDLVHYHDPRIVLEAAAPVQPIGN